jgi:hypothetical protein
VRVLSPHSQVSGICTDNNGILEAHVKSALDAFKSVAKAKAGKRGVEVTNVDLFSALKPSYGGVCVALAPHHGTESCP